MAISPVLQHIHAVQAAVRSAAEMFAWPIIDVVMTHDTIRVASRHESVAFHISYCRGIYDSHGRPMAGGSMPDLVGEAKVHVRTRRPRRGKPGTATPFERLIVFYGVIDDAAHTSGEPITAIHVRGRIFRVICGTRRRWSICTRARCVPCPPYGSYYEARVVSVSGAVLTVRTWRFG